LFLICLQFISDFLTKLAKILLREQVPRFSLRLCVLA